MARSRRIQSYDKFWPHYLAQHSKPATRWFHFFGTGLGVMTALYGITVANYMLVPAGAVLAYSMAWFSHFVVENNNPATFKHPLWSMVSDFRMVLWMLDGRLPLEKNLKRFNPTAKRKKAKARKTVKKRTTKRRSTRRAA